MEESTLLTNCWTVVAFQSRGYESSVFSLPIWQPMEIVEGVNRQWLLPVIHEFPQLSAYMWSVGNRILSYFWIRSKVLFLVNKNIIYCMSVVWSLRRVMIPRDSTKQVVFDADGTDIEENRQLTNLLLENAIAEERVRPMTDSKARSTRVTVLEALFLFSALILLWTHSFASRHSGEQDDYFYWRLRYSVRDKRKRLIGFVVRANEAPIANTETIMQSPRILLNGLSSVEFDIPEGIKRDGATLASCVTSTNPEWAAEAQAFIVWRDAVWAYGLCGARLDACGRARTADRRWSAGGVASDWVGRTDDVPDRRETSACFRRHLFRRSNHLWTYVEGATHSSLQLFRLLPLSILRSGDMAMSQLVLERTVNGVTAIEKTDLRSRTEGLVAFQRLKSEVGRRLKCLSGAGVLRR
jgi:hypothetical protein